MGEKLFFPLFVDLTEKEVLIVGAGKIATRRAKTLLPFAGKIRVIAPEVSQEMADLAAFAEGVLEIVQRPFAPSDLDGAGLVLAVTNEKELNTKIGTLAREKNIPVNVSHEKELCDFYFPGVVRKEDVVIGVTASGSDHALARSMTEKIREMMEEEK